MWTPICSRQGNVLVRLSISKGNTTRECVEACCGAKSSVFDAISRTCYYCARKAAPSWKACKVVVSGGASTSAHNRTESLQSIRRGGLTRSKQHTQTKEDLCKSWDRETLVACGAEEVRYLRSVNCVEAHVIQGPMLNDPITNNSKQQ